MFDEISLGEIMLRLDPRINSAIFHRLGKAAEEAITVMRRCFGLRTAVITALADNGVGGSE